MRKITRYKIRGTKDITEIRLYRPRSQFYHMLFEFNPYDDDDHPSVPHGDSLNHEYKIDLRNGDVYRHREKAGCLSNREFNKLKRDVRIIKVIYAAQDYYKEHHPEITFDPIPWCLRRGGAKIQLRGSVRRFRCCVKFQILD